MPNDQKNTQAAKPGDARMDVTTDELDVDGKVKSMERPISNASKPGVDGKVKAASGPRPISN